MCISNGSLLTAIKLKAEENCGRK